jgi:hypothetical protein
VQEGPQGAEDEVAGPQEPPAGFQQAARKEHAAERELLQKHVLEEEELKVGRRDTAAGCGCWRGCAPHKVHASLRMCRVVIRGHGCASVGLSASTRHCVPGPAGQTPSVCYLVLHHQQRAPAAAAACSWWAADATARVMHPKYSGLWL